MSLNDYIKEFENLNHEISVHNKSLPDTVLAFKILEGAMINDNQREVPLTLASDLSFKSVNGASKRILREKFYMENPNDDNISNEPIIKEENAF